MEGTAPDPVTVGAGWCTLEGCTALAPGGPAGCWLWSRRPAVPLTRMERLSSLHQRAGWALLTLFVGVGLCLDGFHAFKAGLYLDPAQHVRREFWTLAHAHGTLVALVHLAFAAHLKRPSPPWPQASVASALLFVAAALLPGGFFLGGLTPTETDPGLGIWLVPFGGLALLAACALTAIHALRPKE